MFNRSGSARSCSQSEHVAGSSSGMRALSAEILGLHPQSDATSTVLFLALVLNLNQILHWGVPDKHVSGASPGEKKGHDEEETISDLWSVVLQEEKIETGRRLWTEITCSHLLQRAHDSASLPALILKGKRRGKDERPAHPPDSSFPTTRFYISDR